MRYAVKANENSIPAVQRQAGMPDVDGGILPPGKDVVSVVAHEYFKASNMHEVLYAGLGSPALQQARMPAATSETEDFAL